MEQSTVTSLIPKEAVQRSESKQFINRTFAGSLPNFIAAFLGDKSISDADAKEIKHMIDSYKGDKRE